jgi:general secretion pathway protein J
MKGAARFLIGQRGFTLLELVIAIALLSMIVLIIAGAMRLGFRSTESGQKKIEALERFRTSLNIIESQVQSAFSIRQTGLKLDESFTQFKGDRSSMQFRSTYSLLGGSRGPVLMVYAVREESGGMKALFGTESSVAAPDSAKEVRLVEKAGDIYFEYFVIGPTDEKGKWSFEWTSKDTIPDKVRLNIERDGRLFAMIIPVRTGLQTRQVMPGPGPALRNR